MTRAHLVMAAAFLLPGALACASDQAKNGGNTTVRGTVSQSLSTAAGARAVAIGADGRTIWSYLDSHGDFTLKLPVGQSYRVLIANPRVSGGQQTAGYLVLGSGAAATRWLGANQARTIDLGRLSPASTTLASTGVRPQSEAGDLDSASDHDDDNDCKEDDREHASKDRADVCTDPASSVDLEPSNQPGEAGKDEDDHDHKSGHDDGDDDDDDDDDGEHEHGGDDRDHEKPCSTEPASGAPAPTSL